jgi:hypothetical protein
LPDLDDGIRRELERLARPGDPSGAVDRVVRAKRRLRVMRRAQAAALALVVVGGSAGAVVALDRAFRPAVGPGNQPQVGPTVTTSPSPPRPACPQDAVVEAGEFPSGYATLEPVARGDVLGDGQATKIRVAVNQTVPRWCWVLLVVDHADATYVAPVRIFDWLPDFPRFLMTAEMDGQPGVEIVIDLGGPGHPHRSGQVFTYEPSGVPGGKGAVVPMRLHPPQGMPVLFPLGGEFAAGVDCVDEPGTIVVTVGGLAAGGDSHYDVTRTLYVAEQGSFVEVSSEGFRVTVGEEDERWPELADDPFRSCPSG